MTGKMAYNKDTGLELGEVTSEAVTEWTIKNRFGQEVSVAKDYIIFDAQVAESLRKPTSAASSNSGATSSNSGLATFNILVGGFCLLAGLGLLIQLWPAHAPIGYENKLIAYVPGISAGISGLISGLIFFNFAALLDKK